LSVQKRAHPRRRKGRMEGGRQPNPPPPHPARASTGAQNLETHVAKPQAAGAGPQLPGATRKSASCDWYNARREAPLSPSTKAAAAAAQPPPPPAAAAAAAGGRSRSKSSSSSSPPPPPHRRARAPSLPAESSSITGALQRYVSADQMPSAAAADGDLSPAEALPTRSVFIATAVLVGKRNQQRHRQHEQQREERTLPNRRGKDGEEGGVSRSSSGRGGASRTPSPSLTRRVWASASPRFGSGGGSCVGGDGCDGCVSCVSIRRLSSGSYGSNSGIRERSDPVAIWRSDSRDDGDKGRNNIAPATTVAAASPEQKKDKTTTPTVTTVSPTARFYDYWRYCNFRPASMVRAATKDMANDILSTGGEDDEKITVPAPLDPVTSARAARQTPATKRSRGPPAGKDRGLACGESGGGGGGGGGVGNVENESAAAETREDRKGRAEAGAKARTAIAAAAVAERRTEDVKLRLGELRSRPENRQGVRSNYSTAFGRVVRCADCGAPCADWASVAHGSFVCLKCAGQHRSLGMHVVFTRSLVMDKWTDESLRLMEAGGNKRLAEFSRRVGLYPWSTVEEKRGHPCLPLYRKRLAALADGEKPPPISREALEQARFFFFIKGSGEKEASDDDGSDNEKGSSEGPAGGGDPLKDLFKSVTGGCDGVGQVFRRHFCQGAVFRRKGAGGGAGGGEGGEGTGPPRWVADEEQEACMLCERV
ncbi:unnamed protein product, partial [Ectocarpus fasciculatus]